MSKIEFLEKPESYYNNTEFVAKISKVKSEDELFINLSESLKFPPYFGNNWNALSDCLRDFHWIEEKGIVLVHNEFPIISKDILNIYMNILSDAINDWKIGENHYFKIIFPKDSKLLVESFLNKDNYI